MGLGVIGDHESPGRETSAAGARQPKAKQPRDGPAGVGALGERRENGAGARDNFGRK